MLYFDTLPNELLSLISSYLDYEDIKDMACYTLNFKELIRYNTKINTRCEYPFKDAPKINLDDLPIDIESISDHLLVEITSPKDFELLYKFKKLHHANFLLPHNPLESITEFQRYLKVFFGTLVKRKSKYQMKELTFRLLYSSNYNEQLGIIMCRGIIELINVGNFIGFDSSKIAHLDELDFLINCIKDIITDVNLLYSSYDFHGDIINGNLYYDYINKGILPVRCSPREFTYENDLLSINTTIIDSINDGYPIGKWKNFHEKDFLIICIEFTRKFNNKIPKDVVAILNEIKSSFTKNEIEELQFNNIKSLPDVIEFALNQNIKPGLFKDLQNKLIRKLNLLLSTYYNIYANDHILKYHINELNILDYPGYNLIRILKLYSSDASCNNYMTSEIFDIQ